MADKTVVRKFLASTNYYRFTGYAIPFLRDNDRENFIEGVAFENICEIISFDEALRNLVAQALRAVEIDFRTTLAYEHSQVHGAMGYKSGANFNDTRMHGEICKKICDEIDNSKEQCVAHFKNNYNGEIPIWAAIEVVSFGRVSRLYAAMKSQDQNNVAKRYRMQSKTLGSYIQHLSVVRNLCAHHARIWDRKFCLGRNGDGFLPLSEWSKAGVSAANTRFLFTCLR